MTVPLRVGLVAGEASGDTLGADLIHALRRLAPQTEFFGVAGPKMQAAGCESWEPSESLAVMGLFEVLRHLPRLARLLARIRARFLAARPDVFVGIDAPDTNLRLARRLHAAGIPTVQYVSPQVWAWRQGRARSMRESVDLVLCLLPFEKSFYDEHGIPAEFVGHPLADAIPMMVDRQAARTALKIDRRRTNRRLVAGQQARRSNAPGAGFRRHGALARCAAPAPGVRRADGQPRGAGNIRPGASSCMRPASMCCSSTARRKRALIAADVVMVASGTASLEAALCKRPMVVVYRLGSDDRVASAPAESGQNQVLRTAKSTCGQARRRRVFSGRNCSGVDRSGALDVA